MFFEKGLVELALQTSFSCPGLLKSPFSNAKLACQVPFCPDGSRSGTCKALLQLLLGLDISGNCRLELPDLMRLVLKLSTKKSHLNRIVPDCIDGSMEALLEELIVLQQVSRYCSPDYCICK